MATPVVLLTRAVAVGLVRGPAAGLALVDMLVSDPWLTTYHVPPSAHGDWPRLGGVRRRG